jgi:hypothetical protein
MNFPLAALSSIDFLRPARVGENPLWLHGVADDQQFVKISGR